MSTTILSASSSGDFIDISDTGFEKDKHYKEDFAKTVKFIKAHKYSLSETILKNSDDLSMSMIYRVLNFAKHEIASDNYDHLSKRWSFSFRGKTDEGQILRIIVRPNDNDLNIIDVNSLNKSLSFPERQYEPNYSKLLECIDRGEFDYLVHARERMRQCDLTTYMIEDVLKYGRHERKKDEWNKKYERWAFAFRDKIFKKDIRVCITPSGQIITAFEIEETRKKVPPPPSGEKYSKKRKSTSPPLDKSFKQDELDISFDDLLQAKIDKNKSTPSPSEKHSKKHKSTPPPDNL